MASYTEAMPGSYIDAIVSDIGSFKADHAETLDAEFQKRFGRQFDPVLWAYTTLSFLDELKRLLSD